MNLDARITQALRASGLSDEPAVYDSRIHSWRCEYPEQYGQCTCLQELADDLLDAVREWLASDAAYLAIFQGILGRTADSGAAEALNALINRTKSQT